MRKKDIRKVFDALLEVSHHVIYYTDSSQRIIDVSDSIEELIGYTRDEVRGWAEEDHEAIVHPEDRSMRRLLFKEVYNSNPGKIRESEMKFRHRSGEWVLVRVKIRKLVSEEGENLYLGSIMNVSEQQQRDILLNELFKNSFNGFIILSAFIDENKVIYDYKFKMVNPFAEKILRMSESELVGESLLENFPGVRQDKIFDKFVKVSLTGDPLNTEIFYNHEQFNNQWFQISVTRIEDHHLLIGFNDITSKKYAERELLDSLNDLERNKIELSLKTINLEELITERNKELFLANSKLKSINKVLENFVYIAAHDLKSPLWTIKTSLDLMDSTDDHEKKRLYRDYIEADMEKATKTIDGLMEMVKLQADQGKLEAVNVENVIKEVISDIEGISEEKVSLDLELKNISYIKTYLKTIFRNLLTNAVKYIEEPDNLQVTIITRKVEHFVELKITDNGMGIDLETYGSRMFQPFERLTEKGSGSGLGLFIIKNIIEKNGGYIKVDSKPKEGTTFTCYLYEY